MQKNLSKDTDKESNKEKEMDKLYLNTKEYPIDFNNKPSSLKSGKSKEFSVDFVDIGCGYGGLLFKLSENFPGKNAFGIEIRDKVVNYVGDKIQALRFNENKYHNISVVRHNTMRHLTNFFRQNQLEKIFICFPDPNFKTKNFRRRIVNKGFLTDYAYVLKNGGRIYCITDVEELHLWHLKHLREHSLFKEIPESEAEKDICVDLITVSTEESQKVDMAGGQKYWTVFECVKN